jgi:PleD family two-component response regulator
MGLWYVESWGVPSANIKEHEKRFKKWAQYQATLVDNEIKYFRKRFGPGSTRVVMTRFESFTEFDEVFQLLNNDEMNIKLRDEWRLMRAEGTWKGEFWLDIEL